MMKGKHEVFAHSLPSLTNITELSEILTVISVTESYIQCALWNDSADLMDPR
jgi:hypothetical protein